MPITSVYRTGTVTIDAGSTIVVGVGVNFIGAGIRENDLFWANGLIVRVEELIDNESIRLAHPWPGNDLQDSDYEIHYTTDSERVFATAISVLAQLDSPVLRAIKDLEPSNNKIISFTGPNTAELIDTP